MKKLSDKQRIEEVFMRSSREECLTYLDYAGLIMRLRFPVAPVKRGRPSKKQAPPIVAQETAK